jgi:hypothetical protein
MGFLPTADAVAEHDRVLAGLAEFGNIPHGSPPPTETDSHRHPIYFEGLGKIFLPFSPPWDMQEQCNSPDMFLNEAS